MSDSDNIKNPFTIEYYKDLLGEYQTDGFTEWNRRAGFTLFDLSFFEIGLVMSMVFFDFAVWSISYLLPLVFTFICVAVLTANRFFAKRFSSRYLLIYLWLKGLGNFDDFNPFEPPKAGLKKIRYEYTRNLDYDPDRTVL